MDKDKTIEQKKRVIITGDFILNAIREKSQESLSKGKQFPGRVTSATILENIDQLVKVNQTVLLFMKAQMIS